MSDPNDVSAEYRRLMMLKTLAASETMRMSDELLQECLYRIEYGASITVIRKDMAHLEKYGLVSTTPVSTYIMALLTPAGRDVARGLAQAPGVAAQAPG